MTKILSVGRGTETVRFPIRPIEKKYKDDLYPSALTREKRRQLEFEAAEAREKEIAEKLADYLSTHRSA